MTYKDLNKIEEILIRYYDTQLADEIVSCLYHNMEVVEDD